jgi:TonB-dependent receptor
MKQSAQNTHGTKPQRKALYVALKYLLTAGLVMPGIALAQDQADNDAAEGEEAILEEVIVTGLRQSIRMARDAKLSSDAVSDSIMAEDIGKSTDENIAEALNRITGITIQSADGIGSTVTVRGIDPNLNLIQLNGVTLGSSDDGRAVDLSTYSADMLSQIEVVKTSSAKQNEGSLGGTVNLTTARPLDRRDNRYTGEVQWRSTDFDGKDDYKLSLGLIQKFGDERWGIAATIVSDNQYRRADAFTTFDWRIDSYVDPTSLQTGETLPGRVYGAQPRFSVQQVRGVDRENFNANVVLQFQPTDSVDLFLDVSMANLDVTTDFYQLQGKNWHANNPTANNGGNPGRPLPGTAILDEESQTFIFSQSRRIASLNQARYTEETRDSLTATLGGTFNFTDRLTMDVRLNHMELEQDFPVWQQVNFQGVPNNTPTDPPSGFSCGVAVDLPSNDPNPGGTQFGERDQCATLYGAWWPIDNPEYGPLLGQVRVPGREVKDEANSFFIDFNQVLDKGLLSSIDYGAKWSDQSKDRFATSQGISASSAPGYEGPMVIGDYSNPFPFSDNWLGPEIAPGQRGSWLVPDIDKVFAALFPGGVPETQPDPIQTWDVSEEVWAAYAQLNFASSTGRWSGNLGVRYVDTQIEGNGSSGYTFRNVWPTYFEIDPDTDCSSVSGNTCFVLVPVSEKHDYSEFLPSFTFNYMLKDDQMLRFAATKTMARPTFNQIRPNGDVNIPSSGGGFEPTFKGGNTLLEPLVSTNFDISWEWYFGESGLVSAAVFYKDLKDFVFESTQLRRFPNPIDPPGGLLRDESQGVDETGQFPIADVISTVPVNGASAEILGIELSYQQNFDMLPGFWGGFGTLLNYTYTDSEGDYIDAEGEMDPYEKYPFLNTSENSVNATVFWENERASFRLAYSWRDEFLVSPTQLQMSTWSNSIESLDFSFTFQITDWLAITGAAVNLTDFAPSQYQTIAFVNANQPGVTPEGNALSGSVYDQRRNYLQYYGRNYRLGFRVTF